MQPRPPQTARGAKSTPHLNASGSPRGPGTSRNTPRGLESSGHRRGGGALAAESADSERIKSGTSNNTPYVIGKPFEFSVGPAQARIANFDEWITALHYDPKMPTAAQRRALQKAEAAQVDQARRRMSQGAHLRHLLQLSAALRADLDIFVNYLLDNAGRTSGTETEDDFTSAAEAAALNKESYLQLKSLFDLLDVDRSGTLTFDELQRAAGILGRDNYDQVAFQKLDKNRSGSIDFLEMLKVFFPRLSMKYLTKCHREFSKFAESVTTARERLAPEALADIDNQYERLMRLEGGCTVDNLLSFMSPYMQRNRHITEEVFSTFDGNGDGSLSLEEFTELTKFAYPPFAKAPPEYRDAAEARPTVPGAPTTHVPTFSLEQIARRRMIDPKKIKLPHLPTYQSFKPHILNPVISGTTEQRQDRNYRRLVKIIGKDAVDRHEKEARDRALRLQQLLLEGSISVL